MSKRERIRETVDLVFKRLKERWRIKGDERRRETFLGSDSDHKEKFLLTQARKAVRKRYEGNRKRAEEILRQPHLVISFPKEFDVRGISGAILFGGITQYELGEVVKTNTPNFNRVIRLNNKDDPTRGIMIFINDPTPRCPFEGKFISYIGMEFFTTPGTQPAHPWPAYMPVVLAKERNHIDKKDISNRPVITESIMIGILPSDINSEQKDIIFPSPRIEQFLYVTAIS